MKKIGIVVALLLFLVSYSNVFAAEIINPDQQTGNVTIPAESTHKNVYTAGTNVIVDGKTEGDLVAAGRAVIVNGSVEQDLMLAGGTVTVGGMVSGDVRVAGGNVTFKQPISGDLFVLGGNILLSDKATVGGDLYMSGGSVVLEAPVNGSVNVVAGTVYINTKISGDVKIQSSKSLKFGPKSEVLGKITYRGMSEAVVEPGAKISQIQFFPIPQKDFKEQFLVFLSLIFLLKLLSWSMAGFIVMRFGKKYFYSLQHSIQTSPWQNLGYGIAGIIGIPLVGLLVLFTLVGYYIVFMAAVLYVALILFAQILAALLIGSLIIKYLSKPTEISPDWQIVVIGVAAWHLIGIIPIVGLLVTVISFACVFGAMLLSLKALLTNKDN